MWTLSGSLRGAIESGDPSPLGELLSAALLWAREELGWWVARTRRALEALGGMPRASSG